ncbi:hypothetical protein ACTMNS_07285 [Staphylococcus haemolyticus]
MHKLVEIIIEEEDERHNLLMDEILRIPRDLREILEMLNESNY